MTKEETKAYYKEYNKTYKLDKNKVKANSKKHYNTNKAKILAKNKEYQKTHDLKDRTEYFKQYNKDYKKKLLKDPSKLLEKRIANSIRQAFKNKGLVKNCRTIEILGCSFEYFKQHIENQFIDWMTWDNKGLYNGTLNYGWDIDHIEPLCKATTIDDIIRLNHYTNLRPLCSKVNRDIKKGKF